MMTYTVTDIQRFCMHDGFGLRTTVFLKGCPLDCFWCHNPETKKASPELLYHSAKCMGCGICQTCENGAHIFEPSHAVLRDRCLSCGKCEKACPTGALSMSGKVMTADEIIAEVQKDRAFYGSTGGMTVSGGEPMLYPEKCIALLQSAKEHGIHTAVETSGFFDKTYVEPLCRAADVLLWDIKDTDDERHMQNVGVSNQKILENLYLADTFGVPIILRCVLLKGINLTEAHLTQVKRIYASLENAVRVDLLPCHSLGNAKRESLGKDIIDLRPYEPTAEDIAYAHSLLRQ